MESRSKIKREISLNDSSKIANKLASYNNKITIGTRVNPILYAEVTLILRRENKTFQEWINEKLLEEKKIHGDGNPSYTLDDFSDYNFLATPAFHRPKEIWKNYLVNCSDKEWSEFWNQLEILDVLERQVIDLR